MDSSPDSSFDDWLRRSRPRLLRLARSRLRDPGEAEDVVQETVLAVWRRHAAGGVEDLDAYANRAVWQNAIRRKTRWRDWEPLENAEFEGAARVAPEAEEWLEAQELEQAIARLPPAQAAVVRLRFYAGLSFKEMGEALSIGLNTAASRTRYALENLRRSLGSSSGEAQERQPEESEDPLEPVEKEMKHGKGHGTKKRGGRGSRPKK
jgi:RNA polymerase sigma-70 factor, ECF subfamily